MALLAWLATINALLFVFNLIPAFPLDGGRISRAILWTLTGEKAPATRWAGRTGQLFAYAMGGFGLYLIFRGAAVNGLWLAVLAVFLGQAARGAVRPEQGRRAPGGRHRRRRDGPPPVHGRGRPDA